MTALTNFNINCWLFLDMGPLRLPFFFAVFESFGSGKFPFLPRSKGSKIGSMGQWLFKKLLDGFMRVDVELLDVDNSKMLKLSSCGSFTLFLNFSLWDSFYTLFVSGFLVAAFRFECLTYDKIRRLLCQL